MCARVAYTSWCVTACGVVCCNCVLKHAQAQTKAKSKMTKAEKEKMKKVRVGGRGR